MCPIFCPFINWENISWLQIFNHHHPESDTSSCSSRHCSDVWQKLWPQVYNSHVTRTPADKYSGKLTIFLKHFPVFKSYFVKISIVGRNIQQWSEVLVWNLQSWVLLRVSSVKKIFGWRHESCSVILTLPYPYKLHTLMEIIQIQILGSSSSSVVITLP